MGEKYFLYIDQFHNSKKYTWDELARAKKTLGEEK